MKLDIKNVVNYLGKGVDLVEKELLANLQAQNISYSTEYPLVNIDGQMFADSYSVLIGYVLNGDRKVHLYFGFPNKFSEYIKSRFGYNGEQKVKSINEYILRRCQWKFEENVDSKMFVWDADKEIVVEKLRQEQEK